MTEPVHNLKLEGMMFASNAVAQVTKIGLEIARKVKARNG
jgi:hypothetical protein